MKKSLSSIMARQERTTKQIFGSGDYQMLCLIGTRLHNEFKTIDQDISFSISGNHAGSRLEVHVVNNPQLIKFIKHTAAKYRDDLKPYFAKRKTK